MISSSANLASNRVFDNIQNKLIFIKHPLIMCKNKLNLYVCQLMMYDRIQLYRKVRSMFCL